MEKTDWENHLPLRKFDKMKKIEKNCSQIAAYEQKPQSKKHFFVQTAFSQSTLKLEWKKCRKTTHFFAPLPVLASPKSFLQVDFKIHEKCVCRCV